MKSNSFVSVLGLAGMLAAGAVEPAPGAAPVIEAATRRPYLLAEAGVVRFSHALDTLRWDNGVVRDAAVDAAPSSACFVAGMGFAFGRHLAVEGTGLWTKTDGQAWTSLPVLEVPENSHLVSLRRRVHSGTVRLVASTDAWKGPDASASVGVGALRVVEEPTWRGLLPPPPALVRKSRDDSVVYSFGAQIGYALTDRLGVRLKYERLLLDDLETWSPDLELGIFSLGATWKF